MNNLKQTRFTQRKENFLRSLKLLEAQAQRTEMTDENIAATLHFYEITFELSWKLLKDFLEVEGVVVKSPRESIKTAFAMGYLDDADIWLEMLDARNEIVHAYDEQVAKSLFQEIRTNFIPVLEKLKGLQCSD